MANEYENKYLDGAGLAKVWEQIKAKFQDKATLPDEVDNLLALSMIDGKLKEILDNYVESEIEGDNGKASIFNESDGGGAKFDGNDGVVAYVGTHDNIGGEVGVQMYVDKADGNESTILDITQNGIYYTKGEIKPGEQRDVEENEIVTRKDLESIEVPEYSLRKEAGSGTIAAIYHLTKDGTDIGEAINIPKDQLLKSVEIKTCTEADVPVEGLVVGDKYLDFTFIVETGAEQHTYIAVKDMAKPYTAGEGIIITNENAIVVDTEIIATNEYVDANISDTMNYIMQEDAAERAARIAGDNLKVDKKIEGANGEAYIFNESDGGGARFVHNDGSEAFVGVNDGGKDGMMAQIYADVLKDGKWSGSRINVYNDKIYYTNQAAVDDGVAKNDEDHEIATIGDIKAIEIGTLSEAEILEICV